jgi:hypothetical protein
MERPHALLGQDKGERLTSLNLFPVDHLVRVIISQGFYANRLPFSFSRAVYARRAMLVNLFEGVRTLLRSWL